MADCTPAALTASFTATPDRPLAKFAPPYAPKPSIRPLDKLPEDSAEMPPTAVAAPKAVSNNPNPAGPSAAPANMGSKLFKLNASGKPVWGLMVSDVPCLTAKA
jgi:hypothetical protein